MSEPQRLRDYLPHIGRLTIASATLEEIVLIYIMALSDEPSAEVRFKYMHRGLDANLNALSELIVLRLSAFYKQKVVDLIEEARQLKNKRNENVHGVWGEMVDVETREFVRVSRSRYDRDKAHKSVTWDVKTPTIDELEKVGNELRVVAARLGELLQRVWDIDENVQLWRAGKNV